MRTTTTAAQLNLMIQDHIEARSTGEYTWHTPVYLQDTTDAGCNWNIEVNCNDATSACGAVISRFIDDMRGAYDIPAGDPTAVPAYTHGPDEATGPVAA